MRAELNPDPQVEHHRLPLNGPIPNNPDLPVVILRGAVTGDEGVGDLMERTFSKNRWGGNWRNGVFPYHHYHPDAHEVLGCYKGTATLALGGEGALTTTVHAGDIVILPAGTGHKRLEASDDFGVIGGYPPGQEDYDLWRESPDRHEEALERIRKVPQPSTDPAYGIGGPLVEAWGHPQHVRGQ